MRFSVVALAATLIGAVMAQQAYPTAPIGSTIWTVGKSATISWKLNATAKGVPLAITLFKGDPTHQTQVQELSPGVADTTSFKLAAVPALDADWYSVRVGDSYSAQFVIETADGKRPSGAPPSATSVPSVPAVATTSAAAITSAASTAPTATGSPKAAPVSAGSYLSAGPLAVAAAAVVAAALAL
ncbi:hypothetical protein BGZ75_006893 [Mortierella antarctica]|nr:hypothetical protein BGZ67_003263 [Mortierella alpina]KAF9981767.1 hypothetical protein BGZ75_006893 [Mortierella antarctica]